MEMDLVLMMIGIIGASQAWISRPEVSLDQGVVRGTAVRSLATMKTFYAFQKIPYAAPPLGELRYKDPQPPEPWSGILDGGADMPQCIQLSTSVFKVLGEMTEDCLYLSVYTNEIPRESSLLKPVMVWIHGGAFIFGSGNPNNFGPDFLVEKDVLVVLVNYRLGMLGFLNLHNKDVPGNMGLKDQVAALRWVQKNIAKFGGDPKQVTIFGESAGGVSAHFLMLSPMTKGLFQRVICQSGVSLNPWSFKLSVSENNKILLNFVGCGDLEGDELLKCLKEIPVEKLTQIPLVGLNTPTEEDKWVEIPLHVYVTVDDTFLPRAPRQILKDGDYNKVPLLLGINDAEGLLLFNIIMKHQTRLESFNDNMEKMVPRDLELKPGSKDSKEVANMIKDLFRWQIDSRESRPIQGCLIMGTVMALFHTLGKHPVLRHQLKSAVMYDGNSSKLSTDRLFLIGVHQAVQLHAATSDQPIYLYEFAFEGAFGITKPIFGSPLYQGVSHVEDVYYIHAVKNIPYKLFNFSPEMLTLRRMVTMWTNFAKFGNPTPEQSTLLPVTWRPYTPEDPAYLHIKSQLTVERNIEERRMKFWDSVYERYANFTC